MFKRIDHVALLVADLDEAMTLYSARFGVAFTFRERNDEGGFEVAGFEVGDAHVELLAPTRPDSVISGALEKRGPGIHHIGLEVEDLDARLAELQASGVRLTSESPRRGTGGSRIIFLHPKGLLGSMLELVELPPPSSTGPLPE
jgi:methylmalonyl-CoA/ethylmalonyl-CoA epimerase